MKCKNDLALIVLKHRSPSIRNGALTGRRFWDEILTPIVVPYAEAIGVNFM